MALDPLLPPPASAGTVTEARATRAVSKLRAPPSLHGSVPFHVTMVRQPLSEAAHPRGSAPHFRQGLGDIAMHLFAAFPDILTGGCGQHAWGRGIHSAFDLGPLPPCHPVLALPGAYRLEEDVLWRGFSKLILGGVGGDPLSQVPQLGFEPIP
ncbi:hypothetical protein GHT09_004078 [Marmota monax]|uniref:Uncharacterized protein n=1 Tax=Marmota monax TaxID=9995 RepID=A0A834PTZ1_MARMO|nr:hypothetical protein GHT09_004078 [Marmota monax]